MSRSTVPRVTLVPVTLQHLEAHASGPEALGRLIGSPVPAGWPEFPESIEFTRNRLTDHPEEAGWWMHLFIDAATGAMVGSGGYAGPPADRAVEIGYEIAPEHRGRGLGTGAAAALVAKARDTGSVATVSAHTLAVDNPSTRVLEALGFERCGEVEDDGRTVWSWVRHLA